ncbi:MAG: CSLREA domain-containing protein [Blastocatellia bacterium]|nr:CSLREA domain-containing protein [Blastocatellia bacterium]
MLSLLSASGLALQHADASGASWRERAAATATKLMTGYATTRARLATYFAALTVTNDNRNSPAGGIENKGAMTARNSAIVASNGEPFPVTAFACPTSFTVNDLGDAADATPGDQICATAGGVCTLRAAIQEANAITACTPLTIDFSVTGTITLGSALPAIAHPNLTINGPGAASLTVSGNNLYRVLSIASGSYNVNISGLTLSDGYIKGADTTAASGTNIAEEGTGAGLYSLSSGTVNVTDCVITNNTAQGGNATGGTTVVGGSGRGAGIYLGAGTNTLTRCNISNNSALGGLGKSGTSNFDGTGYGAGVNKNFGSLTVTDCTIADNITDRIDGSVLSGFTAAQGAGIYNASGALTVTGSTFSGNRRPLTITLQGAAITNQANSTTITLTNNTFSGNIGSNTISQISSTTTLTMVNCTVANNTLTTGNSAAGAIFVAGGSTLNLKNTVLGNNTDGPNIRKFGTVTSQGNNFDSDSTTGFTDGVNGDIVGTTMVKKDPKLSALGNYGGLTKTQVPLPDSQLLDAGTATGAPATDQRGIARPQGSGIDIGAVEAQAFALTIVGGTPQSTTVGTQFPTALQVNLKEGSNNIQGAPISYVAPGSVGVASTSPTSNTAMTDASGNASITATANTVAGSYNVSAFIHTLVKQFALTNNPGAATNFLVSAPSSATAGSAFNFTVTARDSYGNTVTGYTGTVHFTSSDGVATLPANSTLTNGVGTFSATLKTAGVRTITATDTVTPAITGTSNDITVNPGAATTLMVMAPANATLGSSFNFTVTAKDTFGNTTTGYSGTVHFTSTDGAAALPANSTLTSGTGTLSATLNTINNQTITATDTVTSAITGTSNNIFVSLNTCPTTFTVNDLGDTTDANLGNGVCADASGKCTLRAAIQEANALTACTPLTINFNVSLPNTIMLGSDLPTIVHPNLTITGPGTSHRSLPDRR